MRGRCVGCGMEDASSKKVRVHVQSCPEFLDVFRSDPARAIDPEAEYVRVRAERATEEAMDAREERKAATHATFRAAQARRVEEAADRWSGKTRTRFTSASGREMQIPAPANAPVVQFDESTAAGRMLARAYASGGAQ